MTLSRKYSALRRRLALTRIIELGFGQRRSYCFLLSVTVAFLCTWSARAHLEPRTTQKTTRLLRTRLSVLRGQTRGSTLQQRRRLCSRPFMGSEHVTSLSDVHALPPTDWLPRDIQKSSRAFVLVIFLFWSLSSCSMVFINHQGLK